MDTDRAVIGVDRRDIDSVDGTELSSLLAALALAARGEVCVMRGLLGLSWAMALESWDNKSSDGKLLLLATLGLIVFWLKLVADTDPALLDGMDSKETTGDNDDDDDEKEGMDDDDLGVMALLGANLAATADVGMVMPGRLPVLDRMVKLGDTRGVDKSPLVPPVEVKAVADGNSRGWPDEMTDVPTMSLVEKVGAPIPKAKGGLNVEECEGMVDAPGETELNPPQFSSMMSCTLSASSSSRPPSGDDLMWIWS